MPHQLTIEVADEVYQPLVERAQAAGCSPECLATDLVAQAMRPAGMSPELRSWGGALESGIPDWADRHDEYLGQAQSAHLRPQANE
jgi:hypothetical protein